jgi:outer membrane protein OmpA-like peptidoglycan-associated protein
LSDLLAGSQNNSRVLDNTRISPSFGAQVHYQISHSIGLRARGIYTIFKGEDDDYLDSIDFEPILYPGQGGGKIYNQTFESPAIEGSLEMTYNFGNISFLDRNKNFHMVATLGLGFLNFDAEVKNADNTDQILRTSGNITEMMIPVSLGFKYKVKKIDFGLALEYRKTFTDNVDATVKTYSEYDSYVMLNASANYTFGKKSKPMEWVNPMEIVYNDLAELKEKIDIMSGDKDKDGVSDLFDKDNNTIEGAKVYGDGTTVDIDGDGVADNIDADPFTPKGAKVNATGQESDTDSDGVADSRDLEPGTNPGSLVNFQGVTLAKAGEYGKDGVSGSGKDGKNGTGFLPSIFFDLNSSSVKTAYQDRVLVIAKMMKSNPDVKIKIIGNCDVQGGADENNRLGQRRADAVKSQLVKQYGIDSSRISTTTKGEAEPMASSLNGMNRRVDFEIE